MMVYSPAQRSMAPQSPTKSSSARPAAPRVSSFSQQESQTDDDDRLKLPKRAHTFANAGPAEKHATIHEEHGPDAFETGEHSDTEDARIEITRASIELDILPIELITLIDSFVDSLSAKVHPVPPTIDRTAQLFQEFYATASSHINTHINALASRQSRDVSPSPSASSISSAASRLRSKASSLNIKDKPKEAEQQMITADELAQRKRTRKALEAKRGLLEEAVERRVCEGIYSRIYRHRSTQDEAQDDKLRSKTAALSLVGIGPADLGIDLGDDSNQSPEAIATKSEEIRKWLGQARKDLVKMAEARYPLGKLNHLKAAHRSIVDTLAHFHPSASADEVMPMLIYTLITLPPENLHVISDVHFIENFRWEPKLTGEAAYCLTNLEATISFLQTVDLATLRADEHPSGPGKNASPRTETFPPAYPQGLTTTAQGAVTETNPSTATALKPAASPSGLKAATTLRNRRLSDLVNAPAQAFGAASDTLFNTADQGLKNISNSLEGSYKFLLGKLREHQDGPQESIVVPRTLDDARKLVSTPPPEDDEISGINSILDPDNDRLKRPTREDRVLNLIGGRRDHSTESTRSARSASSSKKVLFASDESKGPAAAASPGQNPAVLEQMRNLGNSLNPMARLPSMSMIRGFGRTQSTPPTPPVKEAAKPAHGGDLATAFPDIAPALPPKEIPKISPPNKRFMELQSPGDLKLGEVLDLLRDYRRLAGALKDLGAFEAK